MGLSLNEAVLAGNVGQDPDIRKTTEGKDVANISIATNEVYKDKQTGEKIERTEWHRVVVWGPLVKSVVEPYVKKGSSIYVRGIIRTREWEKDGVKRYTTEVHIQGPGSVFKLNGGKVENNSQPSQVQENTTIDDEDDIPF